ncbi:hypothetical protein ACKFKG_11215 [Phormidesmis sp. 146-35]
MAIPVGYCAQSPDTDRQIDWLLFAKLKNMSVEDRHYRFRAFNLTWRTRIWGLCQSTETPVKTYLQRRYGAEWLELHRSLLVSSLPMILDPITFTLKVANILAPLDIPYYVSGSVASSLHGESRGTRDIDLAIEIASTKVQSLVQAFIEADFYISETSVLEAIESNRADRSFNVIDNASSEKADIFPFQSDSFAQSKMKRRQTLDFPEGQIYVCTPEDIILQKLKWRQTTGSTEQWKDILGVMKLQQSNLDQSYLRNWALQIKVGAALEQAFQEAGLG